MTGLAGEVADFVHSRMSPQVIDVEQMCEREQNGQVKASIMA